MEERKFVCKYCNKRFPCGKSLGGHIRTHMSSDHNHSSSAHANNDERRRTNNVASSGGVIKFDGVRKRKREFLGCEDDVDGSGNQNSLIYGLRENPKKTMRFVHSNAPLKLDKFCKECGKGFPSLKALCGHMACHSEKEKPTNNNNNNSSNNNRFDNYNNDYYYNYNYDSNNNNSSGISEKQKLVMDSQSDTETSAPRRSKRMMRFKTISNSKNKSCSSSAATLGNGSSSVSEVEQEQEEVARCLMMLSKDNSYHYKARFALFTESSDNNSVVLEAKSKSKSPSVDTKFAAAAAAMSNGKVKDYVSNGYGVVDKKMKKLKYDEVDYDSDNSDSGYFRYGPKKVDSDDSSEEVKPSRKKDFGDFDGESRKIILSREGGRSRNTVLKKAVLDDSSASRKKQNYDESFGISSKKKSKNLNGFVNGKVLKYEFLTSERDNKNNNNGGSDYDSEYESDENSTDTESYPAQKAQSNSKNIKSGKAKKKKKSKLKLKKSKEHECPICNKIFRSGQALGGHKRSHFVGGSEENTLVIRTSAPNHNPNPNPNPNPVLVPCLIDLNLPAPVDE